MSLNLKTDKGNKFKSNNDIEEVLSGNFSLGNNNSDEVDIKINKINTTSPPDSSVNQKIQDKLELSSNKDIDIGLDLLVNKEKKADKSAKQPLQNAYELNSDQSSSAQLSSELSSNVYAKRSELTSDTRSETASRIEEMINDLNIDKTSRLSQDDIDKLIDNQDTRKRTQPKLATPEDIVNELEEDSQNLVSDNIRRKANNGFPADVEFASGTTTSTPQTGTDYSSSQNPNGMNQQHQQQHQQQWMPPQPPVNRELVRKKKQEILFKLEKMRRLGVQGIKHFNMSSDVNEMEEELNRVVHEREVEGSVKFQRKCLMAFVTGAELLNNKMDFLDFKLDGWSEQVNEGINEYNEVFEELHEKYKERAKMAPEVKLLFMLGGSAFMYHLSNSMFKNSIPGMEDIMKQNPDLMKQFASAAINQMNNDEERQAATFMFNNSQAARGQPTMQRNSMPPQQQMPRPSQQQYNRPSPGMPGVIPPQRMQSASSRTPPQYTRGPEPSLSSSSIVNEASSNISNLSQPVQKVKTPFNSSSKIQPPVGVDEILNELKSNTDSQNDNLSEVLSQGNSRSVSIGRSKKGRRSRKKFNLTVGQ